MGGTRNPSARRSRWICRLPTRQPSRRSNTAIRRYPGPSSGAPTPTPRQCRPHHRLPRSRLVNRPNRKTNRHPHPSSAKTLLGSASSATTTRLSLARNPRQLLPLNPSTFVPPTIPLLYRRRQIRRICLQFAVTFLLLSTGDEGGCRSCGGCFRPLLSPPLAFLQRSRLCL